MKKLVLAVAAAAGLAFASNAEAQFAIDLKLAYSIPTGNALQGTIEVAGGDPLAPSMSNIWSGAFDIGVGGRYQFTRNISAGVYFQYAPAFISSSFCPSIGGVSCSGYDMRLGIEAVYAFMPDGSVNPWVSLGTGWQWTGISLSGLGESGSLTMSGWEYFNVQFGVDVPLSKLFALGPYFGYYGGGYTSISASSGGESMSDTIPSEFRSFHGWFQFGVKGTFNL